MSAPRLSLEAATALSRGRRDSQQDAVQSALADDALTGTIALADGCGGHASGDLASNIAVVVALRTFEQAEGDVPTRLREAAETANLSVHVRAQGVPDLEGMSSTLLVVHVCAGQVHWASVGDSPLYILRAGRLRQLNATHSLAHHLDLLARMGEISEEDAAAHPARSCLTSALGGPELEEIDCPDEGIELRPGDVILAASDGVLTLEEDVIAELLDDEDAAAADLADRLLDAVAEAGVETQDNTSVALVRIGLAPVAETRPETRSPGFRDLRRRALASLAGAFGGAATTRDSEG